MKKIVVTVPISNADAVREAIGKAGGGKLGNYSFCSFSTRGTGRFKPEDGANPHIGSVGQPEVVEEERIEVTVEDSYTIEVKAPTEEGLRELLDMFQITSPISDPSVVEMKKLLSEI